MTQHTFALTLSPVLLTVGLAFGLAGCCMGGTAPAAPLPPIAIPSAPAIAAPTAAAAQSVTLGAGFLPDPNVVTTLAGGPISASSMATPDIYCAGYIAGAPNITLTTTTPISGLRVLVRAGEDTTLAIRLADGRVFCDDDAGGYPNPAVMADVPVGVHQVFVGTFHEGATTVATVGFTTNPTFMNASLP